jgi:isoleucyl-tRNA synthetase
MLISHRAVVNVLSNFANITMSSLYLDIVKDILYADSPDSLRRRSVVTVLDKVTSLPKSRTQD